MDRERNPLPHRIGRRRLLAVAAAALVAPGIGRRSHALGATATPAPSAAGTPEASPVASPQASPAAVGPVFESTIQSLKFLPPEIDIEAGTTVIWTNEDVVAHTVTHKVQIEDQLFASPFLLPGETFSFTFEKPGVYPVFCLPHPFMTQSAVVSEEK